MKTIITYGSNYGSSKEYAQNFSKIIHIPYYNFKDTKIDLSQVTTVIHFGSLYAGGILGLQQVIDKFGKQKNAIQFNLVTVGLSDPKNQDNINNIKKQIKKLESKNKIPINMIAHLRGNISYSNLNLKHQLLMKTLHASIKKKDKDALDNENIEFLETYGKDVAFIDLNTLEPIKEWYFNSL